MPSVAGSPFKVDWTNRKEVIDYCVKLGSGNTVYKDPSRPNYNITHTSCYTYPAEWVVYVE